MSSYTTGITTKQHIVDAAGELVAELGFDRVSTRKVAELSNENIGSIHYHFGGKDGLLEAVVYEAIDGCRNKDCYRIIEEMEPDSVEPEQLSQIIRMIVAQDVLDLSRSDRPDWHAQVVYRLIQRKDKLFKIFVDEVMNPSIRALTKFFRIVDPSMDAETVQLHIALLKMPIFGHINNRTFMLRRLESDRYTESYLRKLEDNLVKQTQLLLGLPPDKENCEDRQEMKR